VAFGDGPLIVQSDKTVLLEIDHALADEARAALAPFAELERAPEHVHTYRITPLAVWNARAAGHDAEQLVDVLEHYSRFPVPHALLIDVVETMSRYGRVKLHKHPAHGLILESAEPAIIAEITRHKKIAPMLGATIDDTSVVVHPSERGRLKQELLKVGWPAEDLAGYVDGEAHPIALEETDWSLRDYQRFAADSFWEGGSGVVVLPCGAGKTMVGAAAMAKAQATTLILVTNTVAGRQWRDELRDEAHTPHPRVQIDESLAATIFISIGRNRRVYPRDLVGLLVSVAGLDRDRIGDIRVLANYSFVQLFKDDTDKAIAALNGNIVSVVTDELKEPGVRRLTIKATDITLEKMQSVLSDCGVSVEDIRVV